MTEDNTADGTCEVAGSKRRKRSHERGDRRSARKERIGDIAREDAEDDEIVELQRAAKAGQEDDAPALLAEAPACGLAGLRTFRSAVLGVGVLRTFSSAVTSRAIDIDQGRLSRNARMRSLEAASRTDRPLP